jgi:protein-tyrosine-phosphatase
MAQGFYNQYTHSDDASSAGASMSAGMKYKHPTEDVVKVMREEGIDVSKNIVKPVTREMIDEAEKIVVFCDLNDCPRYVLESGKMQHIKVTDPYWISEEYTRLTRDEVKRAVLDILPR